MPKSDRIGLYPGTFDPITLGHMDIVQRAARVVDHLIIGVAKNTSKDPLFDTNERVRMVKREVQKLKSRNVTVESFDTLLINFAQKMKASVIIRGLRAVSDFEYEIQMAAMNYRMLPEIETIFLTATEGTQFIASRFVREIARLGGNVSAFVSKDIVCDLDRHFKAPQNHKKVRSEFRD